MSPGRGDFFVGQFDAQNLLPNGRGIPSLASSVESEATCRNKFQEWQGVTCVPTLINTGGSKRLSCLSRSTKTAKKTNTYDGDDVLRQH